MFLKATVRPEYRPEDPNPDDMKELPNENTWVFDEYSKLRDAITTIIDPLQAYIDTYARFERDYALDPEKILAEYEDEENWPEVEVLRASIVEHRNHAKRLEHEIPEEIVCSIFRVSTKVIRDMLSEKHTKVAMGQIDLISKISKKVSNAILTDFEKYNSQVEDPPKNI
jgi:hypothetical protein